jgi:hypothetical protein
VVKGILGKVAFVLILIEGFREDLTAERHTEDAMLQIFNCTTISCVLAVVYLSFTGYKMYQMVNPLSGIEVSGKAYLMITFERVNT